MFSLLSDWHNAGFTPWIVGGLSYMLLALTILVKISGVLVPSTFAKAPERPLLSQRQCVSSKCKGHLK